MRNAASPPWRTALGVFVSVTTWQWFVAISAILLFGFLASVVTARAWDRHEARRLPLMTLVLCAISMLFLVVQLMHPSVLGLFERDATMIMHGQWWRLITGLLFQDGGLVGGVTNTSALLLIGAQAEQRLRRWEWMAVYLVGAVTAECVALAWQPIGAGNSVAVCALAGALIMRPPALNRWPSVALRMLAAILACVLVARRDIHGVAVLTGSALGGALFVLRRSRRCM